MIIFVFWFDDYALITLQVGFINCFLKVTRAFILHYKGLEQ